MRKIAYELDIGFAGCGDEGVIEVDDNATDREISEMVDDMANEWAQSWEGDSRLGWDDEMSKEEQEEMTQDFYGNVSGSWKDATDEDY